MRDNPLRQVVGFDAVADCQLLKFGREPPVPADDPFDQAFMAEVIEATILAVALSGRVKLGQIAWRTFLQKAFLKRDGNVFCKPDAHKTTRHNRVPAADQPNGFGGRNDLVFLWRLVAVEHRVVELFAHDGIPAGLVSGVVLLEVCRKREIS